MMQDHEAHMKAEALSCILDIQEKLQRHKDQARQKSIHMLMIAVHMGFEVHVYPDCFQIVKEGKPI